MSIDGMMRTSVSGMAAQSNKLGAVAGNIANASTVGYKRVDAQFSTLLIDAPRTSVSPGGVATAARHLISSQGILESSASKFDLGISGEGFMLVAGREGETLLTRAGAFVPDGGGRLVNAAGYTLLGMPISGDATAGVVVNGTAGLEPVVVDNGQLEANPTTSGRLAVNLPSTASVVAAADLPSANLPGSLSTVRNSIVVYGNLGEEKTLDFHFAKTANPNEWEAVVYDAAGRSATGGFPYSAAALAQTTLVFDARGAIDPASASSLGIAVPGGATLELDLAETTQLATGFAVFDVDTNGNSAAAAASVEIAPDGTIYRLFGNGQRQAAWRIPTATVASPDNLIVRTDNTFAPSNGSGDLRIGVPGSGGLGTLISGTLESSTVDMAAELTEMIAAQRSYTANSRVFQTGAEVMELIVNLKR